MEKKLEVKDLKISFRTQAGKVQAVRNVSFDLYKGETLAIVGESGSGKSVTNRAIMGILAGNGIVESGKIIYDGQDLLKISEEEMVKLRGDKIAMIFQDPLSCLDPIMRIGKQITEAMLLKNKTTRKRSRKEFNEKLGILASYMKKSASEGVTEQEIDVMIKTFDNFCINALKLENEYNHARNKAEECAVVIDDSLFRFEKKQKIDAKRVLGEVESLVKSARNVFLTANVDEKLDSLVAEIAALRSGSNFTLADATDILLNIKETLNSTTVGEKPNFFRIGYYLYCRPEENIYKQDIAELNEMALKFLNEDFMDTFIHYVEKAIAYACNECVENKKKAILTLNEVKSFFETTEFSSGDASTQAKIAIEAANSCINKLAVIKDSLLYTFATTLKTEIKEYFFYKKNNPKEEKRFEKQTAKRDALIAKGKKVDWKVVPKVVVDLDEQKRQIAEAISDVIVKITADVEKADTTNYRAMSVELIDYFKETASQVVNFVTKQIAKERAIKLMEEVGIPEPRIRYKQYPFEFSGGMRQRIVIAIALAANPDILICDEPTTALDVTIQSQILELIKKIKEERDLSVIFITHDLGVVANMADKIAVMYAGKIVEYGTADEVFYDPRHPYTWALLSSMPDLNTNEKLDAIPGTPPNMIYPPVGDAFAERNKYAMEIDFEMQPPMFEITPTHSAATWLLHPDAPKVEIPKIITDRIERMKAVGGGAEDGKQ